MNVYTNPQDLITVLKALDLLSDLYYCQFIENGKEYDKCQEVLEIKNKIYMTLLLNNIEPPTKEEINEITHRISWEKLYKFPRENSIMRKQLGYDK